MKKSTKAEMSRTDRVCTRGFSLLELLVATAVFLLVSGVAFTLFTRHQAVLNEEQLTVGLNIGLRNALAQIQLDVANAGNGLILGTNVASWPVGVTIVNNPNPSTAACNPTNLTGANPPVYVYQNSCFDQLNVIVVDPNTPAINPCAGTGCTVSTSAGTTANGPVPAVINPATGNPFTAAQLAGHFHAGDQVLFVKSCSGSGHLAGSSGCAFTTAVLSAGGAVNTVAPGCAAGCVGLTFTSTNVGGGNPVCPTPTPSPNTCNDPLNMTSSAPAAQLTDTFGPTDWMVRLLPITYSVNGTHVESNNEPDPQLTRSQGGTTNVVMDQVIGFKVGAALWNSLNTTSNFEYNYSAGTYANGSVASPSDPYDFTLVRSVRVTIIGRTEPNPRNPYRNLFDSGAYQIRGSSIVVDPRNLTMNND